MKQKLVSLDKRRTGRVPLSKFYGKSLTDAEWRFGESESYLRSLTSMDEKAFNLPVHVCFPNSGVLWPLQDEPRGAGSFG